MIDNIDFQFTLNRLSKTDLIVSIKDCQLQQGNLQLPFDQKHTLMFCQKNLQHIKEDLVTKLFSIRIEHHQNSILAKYPGKKQIILAYYSKEYSFVDYAIHNWDILTYRRKLAIM